MDNQQEGLGQSQDKNPHDLGKDLNIAMYIVYKPSSDEWGVIGAPGFLDEKNRAYFALMMAEKQLDSFYAKREAVTNRIITGTRNFAEKMNFRNFFKNKK